MLGSKNKLPENLAMRLCCYEQCTSTQPTSAEEFMAGDHAEDQTTVTGLPEFETSPLTADEQHQARLDEEARQRNAEHMDAVRAAATSGKGNPLQPVDEFRARQNMNGFRVAAGSVLQESEAPYHPSPSFSEENVKTIQGYEEFAGYLQPALNALGTARTGLEAIDAAHLALRKDTSKTPEQKLLLVSGQAVKKYDQMNGTLTKAVENLQSACLHIEKELDAPIVSAAQSATNNELRAVIRGMKPEERSKVIIKAISDGDDTVINAVLGVHPLIVGISPEMQKIWSRQVHEKREPEKVKRLNATREAIKMVERVIPLIHAEVERAQRGTFRKVAQLQGQFDASAKALAAILGQQST
ncbi:MAG: hypothetical protein ACJ8R9_02510 [Steroidobacteraceae bacterium]